MSLLSKSVLSIAVLSFLLSSCAYFNTFHNTKKFYNEAKKEREKRTTDQPTPQELQKYEKTIEKASRILEVYPKSKYVDDALVILGECFYYKGDYVKAQRKFQELITYFPKSDYLLPAKIWLARTNIMLEDYNSARINLDELLRTPKLKRKVLEESRFLLGETYYEQENYEAAAKEYQNTIAMARDNLTKTRAYLRLGECQEINQSYDEAVNSFENAIEFSNDPGLEFEARLGLCRILKFAENFKASIKVCSELLENSLYQKDFGYVKLEMADCVYREGLSLYDKLKGADVEYLGKVQQALEEYEGITEEFKKTPVSATAYYRMGMIYEEDFGDFPKAMDSFNKVRVEYPKSELVDESTTNAKDIGDLIRLKNLIKKSQGEQLAAPGTGRHLLTNYESLLLEHGVHPELRFMARMEKTAKLDLEKLTSGKDEKAQEEKNLDELVTNKLQLAEVYLFQFGQIDSALFEYGDILKFFPEHREAAKALYSMAFVYENEFQDKSKTDSLLTVLVQRFPDSYQAEDARRQLGLPLRHRVDNAARLFATAEQTLFEKKNARRAITLYQRIIDRYPNSEYAPKALFAQGWIQDQILEDNEKAGDIYRQIQSKYPNSEFSKRVSKKLEAVDVAANPKTPEGKKGLSDPSQSNQTKGQKLPAGEKEKLKESTLKGKKKKQGNLLDP